MQYSGELFAILAALLWSATAMIYEKLGKKVSPDVINFIRLGLALIFLCVYTYFTRGMFFPVDADSKTWFWLFLSGLIGFVFGDLFLFKALSTIGARISMLIMATNPIFAAILGRIFLHEELTAIQILGMSVVLSGVFLVILQKKNTGNEFKYSVRGVVYAALGSLGQGVGLVVSKFGMGNYNAFAASEIRVIAGVIGFFIILLFTKKLSQIKPVIISPKIMSITTVAAFFGSFLGISFSLLAVKYASTGVASTLMTLQPILLILPTYVIFKEKINLKEIVGAFISVIGVTLLFI